MKLSSNLRELDVIKSYSDIEFVIVLSSTLFLKSGTVVWIMSRIIVRCALIM